MPGWPTTRSTLRELADRRVAIPAGLAVAFALALPWAAPPRTVALGGTILACAALFARVHSRRDERSLPVDAAALAAVVTTSLAVAGSGNAATLALIALIVAGVARTTNLLGATLGTLAASLAAVGVADSLASAASQVVVLLAAAVFGRLLPTSDGTPAALPFAHALRREGGHAPAARGSAGDLVPAESQAARTVEASVRATLELTRRVGHGTALFLATDEREDAPALVRFGTDHAHRPRLDPETRVFDRVRSGPWHPSSPVAAPWRPIDYPAVHAVATPITDEGLVVGAVLADRPADAPPFNETDLDTIELAGRLVSGSLRAERALLDADRAQSDYRMFLDAAAHLAEALTLDEVCTHLVELVQRFVPCDAMALVVHDDDADELQVVTTQGDVAAPLRDRTLPVCDGLVALAIARRHTLPYSGSADRRAAPVFADIDALPQTGALAVLPVVAGQQALGAVVLWAPDHPLYTTSERARIESLVRWASPAIGNALAYRQALHRATVDGMTGLLNHRTFRERAALALERAERTRRTCAVIMLDIDHFKRVNDTWGHAMGDRIIIAVAETLRAQLRKSDLGGRYGGEEFAILLEETEMEAATQLAERLRTAVRDMRFDTDDGTMGVTLSLGVAVWPDHGDRVEPLVEAADAALYTAKQGGRDQVRQAPR